MSLCKNANLIRVRENLYNKATGAVHLNRRRLQNGSRIQKRPSAPTDSFNIFLERIMTDELEDHKGTKLRKKVK